MLKNKCLFISIMMFALILSSSNATAILIDEDETDDVYSISLLGFFSVIGESIEDPPEDKDDLVSLIVDLVDVSTLTDEHDEVDIVESNVVSNGGASAMIIQFDENVENDELTILGFGEHNNNRFAFNIQLNGSSVGEAEYTTEEGDNTDTTAWIDNDEVAFVFNTTDFDYEDGDDFIVLAMMTPSDFNDPMDALGAQIFYDFAPNEEVDLERGSYEGRDIITSFIDNIANFLFAFLPGGLSFKLLIALLVIAGQFLLDRKNKILHIIGAVFLMLLLYPIFMYSIAIDFSSALGFNIVSMFEMLILVNLGLYIVFALLVSFKLIRHKNFAFIAAGALMISESVSFLTLFNTGGSQYTINLWFIVAILIGCLIALILSRKWGRTPK